MNKVAKVDLVSDIGSEFGEELKKIITKRQGEGYEVELITPAIQQDGGPDAYTWYSILVISRYKE